MGRGYGIMRLERNTMRALSVMRNSKETERHFIKAGKCYILESLKTITQMALVSIILNPASFFQRESIKTDRDKDRGSSFIRVGS